MFIILMQIICLFPNILFSFTDDDWDEYSESSTQMSSVGTQSYRNSHSIGTDDVLENCLETHNSEYVQDSAGKATTVDASTQFDGDPEGKVSFIVC